MYELRQAILEMLAETIGMEGAMTPEQAEVVKRWNNVCEASPTVGIPDPITPEDLEEFYED